MKKILVYCPDSDGTSWYRGARPWQLLEKSLNTSQHRHILDSGPGYQIDYFSGATHHTKTINWDTLGFYDLVFIQRPYQPEIRQLAIWAKRMGSKLWMDEDDVQTAVPWDMHSAYLYNQTPVQEAIRGSLELTDVLTVSTEYLGEYLKKVMRGDPTKLDPLVKGEVIHVPNAFDLDTFPRPEIKPKKEKIILWRGAWVSHVANLDSVRKDIYEIMDANSDWKFVFFGFVPWWYTELKAEYPKGVLPTINFLPPTQTLWDYYATIADINPSIWVCPLIENPFNLARSNNAWADACWTNSKVIAPRFAKEWHQPNVTLYDESLTFKGALQQEINKVNAGESADPAGWEKVSTQLNLKLVNEKRIEIVKKLIG